MNKELETFFDLLNKQSELTSEEIELREKYFRSQIFSTENSGEARAKLKDFFFTEPRDTIEKSKRFWYSYWRWCTMLNWAGFMGLSEADMLFSLAYQVPMAVALSYNPADELRRYLALSCPYEDDMADLYAKAQPAFLTSEAYAGLWQGKEVNLSELIKELTDIGFEEDSLRQAEFENKLTQILFPNNELVEKYFLTSSDVGVKRFISLVIFLQSVNEDEIWLAVDNFMYPEKYTDKVLAEISSLAVSTATPVKPAPVVRPSVPPAPKPATLTKLSPQQIKSQIESQFKKDAEGNFADVEGVMARLNELAEKNNDPKINDLLYYDEGAGKFKWNV